VMGLLVPSMRRAPSMAEKIISEGTFSGHFDDRERAVEVFVRHNEGVKRRVPAEKLLVFEVKEGWGALCEFLGVEAPDRSSRTSTSGTSSPG
jgi:sulfotransferase family protein